MRQRAFARAARALRDAGGAAARRRLHRRRAVGGHRQRRAPGGADASARRAAALARDDASGRRGGDEPVPRRPARALARGGRGARAHGRAARTRRRARAGARAARVRRRVGRNGPPRPSRASRAEARSWSRSSPAAPAGTTGSAPTGDTPWPPRSRSSRCSASASQRLPEDARRLLEVVAIGGRPLPVSTVGAGRERRRVGDAARRASARPPLRARGPSRRARGGRGDPRPDPRDHRRAALRGDRARAPRRARARARSDARLGSRGDRVAPARRGRHGARRPLRRARGGAGHREARVRAGGAAVPADDARRSAGGRPSSRGCTGARPRPPSGPGWPRRRRARTWRRRTARRCSSASISSGRRPRSSSPPGSIDEGAAIVPATFSPRWGGRCRRRSSVRSFWVIVYRAVSALLIARSSAVRPCFRSRTCTARRPLRGDPGPRPSSIRSRRCTSRRGTSSTPCAPGTAFTSCMPRPSEARNARVARAGRGQARKARCSRWPGGSPRRAGTPRATRSTRSRYGICLYLRGHWRASLETLDVARKQLAAARRWNANANVFAVYALAYLGDLREVEGANGAAPGRRGAARRSVHGGQPPREPPDRGLARRQRPRGGAPSHPRVDEPVVEDALFGPALASDALGGRDRPLRRRRRARLGSASARRPTAAAKPSPQRAAHSRASLTSSTGRSALASLDVIEHEDRRRRLGEAKRSPASARARGDAVDGAARRHPGRGRRGSGGRSCGRGEGAPSRDRARRRSREMALHAASARRQLGVELGGDAGKAMVHEADEAMRLRGVRDPARYAKTLVPLPAPFA